MTVEYDCPFCDGTGVAPTGVPDIDRERVRGMVEDLTPEQQARLRAYRIFCERCDGTGFATVADGKQLAAWRDGVAGWAVGR